MGKRIGSYINPVTGEEDWFEPDTINMIILQPRMVTKVGDTNQSSIEFKLDSINNDDTIVLTAEYESNDKKYVSTQIETPSETFADELKDIIYADKSLDESDLIISMKDKACEDLTRRLMDNGILTGGMKFTGFGFVYADNDKVLTIESIDFDYRVSNGRGIYTAEIHDCVGQASLNNLENPIIKLWNGTHSIEVVNPKVEEALEGRLKDYRITMSDIVIKSDFEMPEHKVFENPNFSNENFMDEFITERKSLLDDISGNDSDLEDRFDDLF